MSFVLKRPFLGRFFYDQAFFNSFALGRCTTTLGFNRYSRQKNGRISGHFQKQKLYADYLMRVSKSLTDAFASP